MQTTASDEPYTVALGGIGGTAHGGVNPIIGGNVILWETQTSSSGCVSGCSTYGSAALQVGAATTGSDGSFSITPTGGTPYTCTSTEYLYITITGGNTGANAANPNSVQMAAMGSCALFQTTAVRNDTYVYVSELSTVAAAYALSNFISIAAGSSAGNQIVSVGAPYTNAAASGSCSGTGSTLACTSAGLAHAFQNAYDLVDIIHYGGGPYAANAARTQVPLAVNSSAVNTNSVVPQALINTIGNILEACVNTTGGVEGDSSACGNLFLYTKSLPSAAYPTDTLQATVNLAKNPVTYVNGTTPNQTSSVFAIASPNTFYQPSLTTAPSDFSLAIFYTGTSATSFGYVYALALDANDNVNALVGPTGMSGATGVITSGTSDTVYSMTYNGVENYAAPAIVATTTYINPGYVAVDSLGNAWVTNNATGSVQQDIRMFNSATPPTITTVGSTQNNYEPAGPNPFGIAIDRLNNIWYSGSAIVSAVTYYQLRELKQGAPYTLATFTNIPYYGTMSTNALGAGVAVDAFQNIWSSGRAATLTSFLFPNSGSSTTPAYANSMLSATLPKAPSGGMAIDASGVAWYSDAGTIDKVTPSSASATPTSITVNATSVNGNSLSSAAFDAYDGDHQVFFGSYAAAGYIDGFYKNASAVIIVNKMIPCFPVTSTGTTCANLLSSSPYSPTQYARNVQVDSAGSVWVAAGASSVNVSPAEGYVVQIIGTAAPAWPLLAYGKPGVKP